jgi:hypothetical protein
VRSTEVGRDRGLEATSATTDQVALEALGACSSWSGYPQISRAETAPGLDNLEALSFEWANPEVWPLYSRGHTKAQRSECVFDAPEGAPHRIATMASGLISLRCTESSSVSRLTNEAPASEEAGCSRVAGATARPEAGGPRAGQVRPRSGPAKQVAGCSPE